MQMTGAFNFKILRDVYWRMMLSRGAFILKVRGRNRFVFQVINGFIISLVDYLLEV